MARVFRKRRPRDHDNNKGTLGISKTQVEPAQQCRRKNIERLLTATNQMPPQVPLATVAYDLLHHLGIGLYVKTAERLTINLRYDFLMKSYVPPTDYSY